MKKNIAQVLGIIIAADTSHCTDTKFLPFNGIPIVQHSINAAHASLLHQVSVIMPSDESYTNVLDIQGCLPISSHHFVEDKPLMQTIGANIHNIHLADGCMLLPGNQPLITSSILDSLILAFSQQPTCWIAPVQEDMRGNPMIIPRAWYERLCDLQCQADVSSLHGIKNIPLRLVKIYDPGAFLSVDTPQEYQRLRKAYDTTFVSM